MERPCPVPLALLPDRAGAQHAIDLAASVHDLAAPVGYVGSALWRALLGGEVLDDDELKALQGMAQTRQVSLGQRVLSRSKAASTLVALCWGEVALGFRTSDGIFRTERIVRGPAWLDLSSAWLAEPHSMDAQALGPASVIEFPCKALEARLAQFPGLAQGLIQGLAREVQALTVNTHELMHKAAPARLAQWLHQRCEPASDAAGQAMVKLHERKRDVASQLAITPETLSRLMRIFSRQGVIEVCGYTVKVLDPSALARLAQS